MASGRPVRLLFVCVLYAFVSCPVLCIWVTSPGVDGYMKANYIRLLEGRAAKPYVLRALTPQVIRGFAAILEPTINEEAANKAFDIIAQVLKKTSPGAYQTLRYSDFRNGRQAEYIAGYILCYVFLIVFGLCLRALIRELYDTRPIVSDAIPAFAVACLPAMFRYHSYVYDFPQLILFTLGLLFVYRRNTAAVWTVYVIGLFNKETMVLLPLLLWLEYRHEKEAQLWLRRNLAAMAAAYVVVRTMLLLVFRENEGGRVEFHFFDHTIGTLWTHAYSFGFFVTVAVIALGLFYEWKEKPALLRHGLLLGVPLVSMGVFFGFLDEFRDYYEIYPAAFLLIAHSVCHTLDVPLLRE
ncbi:MAG: hypothetical protein M5R36_24535 [Deltaproteobacteria bacterium]|nr:hypothetical protein [Deltaproteobacteria bacterium]